MIDGKYEELELVPDRRRKDIINLNRKVADNYSSFKQSMVSVMSRLEEARIHKCQDKKRQILSYRAMHPQTMVSRNIEWKKRVGWVYQKFDNWVEQLDSISKKAGVMNWLRIFWIRRVLEVIQARLRKDLSRAKIDSGLNIFRKIILPLKLKTAKNSTEGAILQSKKYRRVH